MTPCSLVGSLRSRSSNWLCWVAEMEWKIILHLAHAYYVMSKPVSIYSTNVPRKWRQYIPLKHWSAPIRIHGVVMRKTTIWNLHNQQNLKSVSKVWHAMNVNKFWISVLGSCAHVTELHRFQQDPFMEHDMLDSSDWTMQNILIAIQKAEEIHGEILKCCKKKVK